MDKTPPNRKPSDGRPNIWADGSQKPRFDPRAFAFASLHMAREGVAPLLTHAAAATAGFGQKVASGTYRVPADRWGRVGRYLPSYSRVAGWIGSSAQILDRAGQTADPLRAKTTEPSPSAQPAAPATPGGVVPVRPRAVRKPAETAAETAVAEPVVLEDPEAGSPVSDATTVEPQDSETLQAIRSIIGPDSGTPVARGVADAQGRASHDAATQPDASSGGGFGQGLVAASGVALGWGVSLVALPYGIVRAKLAHLNGQDLRKINDDG
ncbi:hypothetical protein [Tabrizicola sp.]|uniref:hypothetical protein n=1 Tax=Tabrizicola sp. TaxID=2005166 RepID=UPI00286BB6AE|nr:hypothetical protein [Tabrizicola sp.]